MGPGGGHVHRGLRERGGGGEGGEGEGGREGVRDVSHTCRQSYLSHDSVSISQEEPVQCCVYITHAIETDHTY